MDSNIFKKVLIHERANLFRDLEKSKSEVLCKIQKMDDYIQLQAVRYDGVGKLICSLHKGSLKPEDLPQSVVVTFGLGADKFFLTTELSALPQDFFQLDLSVEVFQLQRRQSYRIRIPESYSSATEVSAVNGQKCQISGVAQDLSGGGCRLALKKMEPLMKMGDTIQGTLVVGKKPSYPFTAQVRHHKADPKTSTQVIGVEFTNLTPALEGRMFAITMELHRELFSRWGDR